MSFEKIKYLTAKFFHMLYSVPSHPISLSTTQMEKNDLQEVLWYKDHTSGEWKSEHGCEKIARVGRGMKGSAQKTLYKEPKQYGKEWRQKEPPSLLPVGKSSKECLRASCRHRLPFLLLPVQGQTPPSSGSPASTNFSIHSTALFKRPWIKHCLSGCKW